MKLERRWLLLREPGITDAVGQAALEASGLAPRPGWAPIERPDTAVLPPGEGDVADALAMAATLATPECHFDGLRLALGPGGLEAAYTRGPAPACLRDRLWGLPWPATAAVELEL